MIQILKFTLYIGSDKPPMLSFNWKKTETMHSNALYSPIESLNREKLLTSVP